VQKVKKSPSDKELYYIDESSVDEFYAREYGYAPRGERVFGEISGRKFKRTNLVSAYCNKKSVAPFEFEGTMDGDLFEGWFEKILISEIENPEKAVVILDGASFHKKQNIYEIADEYGIEVIFLPPYSPDLNPIENFWANLKKFLRNFSHNFQTIQEAIMNFFQVV
jgi:transposase